MSELKVGDKRKWDNDPIPFFEILCTGREKVFIRYEDGIELIVSHTNIIKESSPYAEPAPVQKIVAHVCQGNIELSFEGSPACKARDESNRHSTRIPFELGGGA